MAEVASCIFQTLTTVGHGWMYGALSACQRLQQANRFQEHDVTRCIVGLGGHHASIHQALSTCSTNANSSSITTKAVSVYEIL